MADLGWFILAVTVGLLVLSNWAKHRPTVGIRLTGHWGKVYILQDLENPRLFKVGMTYRTSELRRREVQDVMAGGSALRVVFEIHTPYPLAIETVAHRRLRNRRHRSERGREWFKADDQTVRKAVIAAYRDVRRIGKRQGRWSKEADGKVWVKSYRCGR